MRELGQAYLAKALFDTHRDDPEFGFGWLTHLCYVRGMGTGETVGLRELRQHASEVVRRVESGRSFTVTVNGRPAAEIVPVQARRWRTWAEVRDIVHGPGDPDLVRTLAEWDDVPTDPFAR